MPSNDELFGGDNFIDIELSYSVQKNKSGAAHVTILDDTEAAKLKADEKTKDSVKTLRTKWIQQTWQAANDLLKRATVFNFQTNQSDIDWTAYRHARLVSCLVDWDAKDKDGIAIPCTEVAINKLHANVAVALLEKYDKATSIDADEKEKN